jgi:phage shock protein PspC (stress-responsive transcriptional regulator)
MRTSGGTDDREGMEQTTPISEPGSPDNGGHNPDPRMPDRTPLRRSTSDRVIGGVSGGLGRRYGIDPVILRVVFVVGILLAGLGPLIYLALWLLLPDDTDQTNEALTRSPVGLIFGLLVALVAAMTALSWLSGLGGLSGLVIGGFLVGLTVWLYSRRGYVPGPATVAMAGPQPPPPAGFAYGGTGGGQVGSPAGDGTDVTDSPGSATYPAYQQAYPQYQTYPTYQDAAPAREPRPRSYLGLITVCAVLIVAGVLGTVQALGWIDLSAVAFMAVLLGVLAVGLLVGTFVGRARWLIAPAIVLSIVMAVTAAVSSVIPAAITGGMGERVWTPTTAGQAYQLGLGSATLDLTDWAGNPLLDQPGNGDTINADLTVGDLQVQVPDTWNVLVDAHVRAGQIMVNGVVVDESGDNATFTQLLPATGDATGTIRLDLDSQVGTIDIDRVDMPAAAGQRPSPAPTQDAPKPQHTSKGSNR